ncbi:hypothetical protein ACIQBJ_25105 [Kitasatospora sp. NPDC088391]|uniref:hypothetical protein n=1 Tax=Kitasatospora sp. NPDC088391 TaxID=3364074 RepID=UPI00382EC767
MGMSHATSRDIGNQAVALLKTVKQLFPRTGFIAGDLAYAHADPDSFHRPVRALGYEPVLDYRLDMLQSKKKETWRGALALGGDLLCPHTPQRVKNAYRLMASAKSAKARRDLLPRTEEADPYVLSLKQRAAARGNERHQCPAAGASPKVQCPWATERDAHRRTRTGTPPRPATRPSAVVDLDNRHSRRAHTAAKPIVPVGDLPMRRRPEICQQSTIGAPADLMPKLHQELSWGRAVWQSAYSALRSHIEGLNGRAKNVSTFLHARELRQSRGRAAQALLSAVQLMVENLRTIESYLRRHHLWADRDYTLTDIYGPADPLIPTEDTPAADNGLAENNTPSSGSPPTRT